LVTSFAETEADLAAAVGCPLRSFENCALD